jgi:hypothetical protein
MPDVARVVSMPAAALEVEYRRLHGHLPASRQPVYVRRRVAWAIQAEKLGGMPKPIAGKVMERRDHLGRVACALAQQACRKGYRAIYRRASRLFAELALARATATYARVLARLAKVDVLVLDDWAMAPITDVERRDLLEVLEDRHGTRYAIVTSQVPHKRGKSTSATPPTPMPFATA